MHSLIERREDFVTAAAVSEGMAVLAEYGREQARAFLASKGIKEELTERMLLMGYNRRRVRKSEQAL